MKKDDTPETVKRASDPMLLLTAKLDRILVKMPPSIRRWAVGYLALKYGETDLEKTLDGDRR